MLFELIGPAGSGKTTAARGALDLLRERGVDVVGFEEIERLEDGIGTRSLRKCPKGTRKRIIAGLAFRYPGIVLPILMLSWLHGPEQSTGSHKRRRRHAWRAIGHVRMALALRRMADDHVVLVHEGFTQVLWTLLVDSSSLKARWLIRFVLARYHAAFRQRGIRLLVDDNAVIERVFARDTEGRFNRNSDEALRSGFPRWLEDHRALVAMLPTGLIKAGIDGSDDSDRAARDLAAAIVELMPNVAQSAPVAVGAV